METITKNYQNGIQEVYQEFLKDKPYIFGTDTETSGLDQRIDKPFMIIVGWLKLGAYIKSYSFYITEENKEIYKKMVFDSNIKYHFMWNMKFDIGMLKNINIDLYPLKNLFEGMVIPRLLFNYYDRKEYNALKKFGEKHLSVGAKVLQDQVKLELANLTIYVNHNRALALKKETKWTINQLNKYQKDPLLEYQIPQNVLDAWKKIQLDYPLPRYQNLSQKLVEEYATNDVVLMLMAVNNFFGNLMNKESKDYQAETVIRESQFAKALSVIEKNGMRVDKDYLLQSKEKLVELIKMWYNELWELLGVKINVGQHTELINWFRNNGTPLHNRKNIKNFDAQDDTLLFCIENLEKMQAKNIAKKQNTIRICELIRKLRSYTKWYSTYLVKYLNELVEIDGKHYIFGSINSFGTQTGRVSSSWQQFPREYLTSCFCERKAKTTCAKSEHFVYSPRAVVIPRYENGYLGFLDYSQMELRVASDLTLKIDKPDLLWLNAYFNYNKKPDWKPYDIHTDSAKKIFGVNDETDPHLFKELRTIAKTSNFAILYGGSVNAVNEQAYAGQDYKKANNFYTKFKETYPGIIAFQTWCADQVSSKHRITNSFGRIYRWLSDNPKTTREAGSCMIQGSCADFVKERTIAVQDYLVSIGSNIKIINTIHDEIVFDIPENEKDQVYEIKKIMEDQSIWEVPLEVEISLTKTNWADKEKQ